MNPCWVCGELFDELDLEQSPSGIAKLVCADCAEAIQGDLDLMYQEEERHSGNKID